MLVAVLCIARILVLSVLHTSPLPPLFPLRSCKFYGVIDQIDHSCVTLCSVRYACPHTSYGLVQRPSVYIVTLPPPPSPPPFIVSSFLTLTDAAATAVLVLTLKHELRSFSALFCVSGALVHSAFCSVSNVRSPRTVPSAMVFLYTCILFGRTHTCCCTCLPLPVLPVRVLSEYIAHARRRARTSTSRARTRRQQRRQRQPSWHSRFKAAVFCDISKGDLIIAPNIPKAPTNRFAGVGTIFAPPCYHSKSDGHRPIKRVRYLPAPSTAISGWRQQDLRVSWHIQRAVVPTQGI